MSSCSSGRSVSCWCMSVGISESVSAYGICGSVSCGMGNCSVGKLGGDIGL